MRVRYDDERKIAERLYAMREAGGEDGEGEVGRCEELLRRERWSSVSVAHATLVSQRPARDSATKLQLVWKNSLYEIGQRQRM